MKTGKYRIKKYPGIYGYDSSQRRVNGKPDFCYYIVIKIDGKNKTEKIGWMSEGYTAQLASEVRSQRIRQARHDGQVKTAREIRAEKRIKNRSLGEIKDHFFASEHGKALKGRYTDLNRWKNHLSHLTEKSVSELSQIDIERIKQNMRQKDLRPATIRHALRLLLRIINHGTNYNICPPLNFKIKFPKINNKITEFLTPEQANHLMTTLDNWNRQDVARMIKLAWLTGMRRGELFRLKTTDLNFSHDIITLVNPKGGKDTTIPMSPPAKEILLQQIAFLENERIRKKKRYNKTIKAAPQWEENDFLFPGT